MTDTAPASTADPHRSLNRSVKGVFENLRRTVDSYTGEGDIIEVASAALAAAGNELAALLKTREADNAAYVAKMEAEAKMAADAGAAYQPTPQAAALTDTAAQAEALVPQAAPAPAESAPAPTDAA